MKNRFIHTRRLREAASAIAFSVYNSPRSMRIISWFVLLLGLLTWIVIQGHFTVMPFWNRSLPFESGPPLVSILEAKETAECLSGDCPALTDLRKQLLEPASDPGAIRQQELVASVVFAPYSPLMSIILLGMSKLGLALTTAYKVIWTVWPFFFGVAVAALIAVLWGPAAAGIVLIGCAFKVFPGETLQYVGPSNLAMGIAMLMLARILSRGGDAPWTLVIGSIVLVAMHPIGRIYALMTVIVGLLLCKPGDRIKNWCPFALAVSIVASAFLASALVDLPFSPAFGLAAPLENALPTALGSLRHTLEEIIAQVIQVESGIFGSLAFYLGTLAFAFFVVSPEERAVLVRVLCVCVAFLCVPLFYGAGNAVITFLMLLIPLLFIVFGAFARAFWYALTETVALWTNHAKEDRILWSFSPQRAWPMLVLALIFGWGLHVGVSSTEQLVAVSESMRNREPGIFDPAQPEQLKSSAKPGDAVLYTSIILMPYYFIHSALQYGAVYYHPGLAQSEPTVAMLRRPDLRFAVAYNPIVGHPDLEGIDETGWRYERPRLRYSPLNKPEPARPISRKGMIPAFEFRWVEVEPRSDHFPLRLSVLVSNSGPAAYMELIPFSRGENPLSQIGPKSGIPAGWSGWIEFDLQKFIDATRFRIVFPQGGARFSIGGIAFGKRELHWPWAQKAAVFLMPRASDTDVISLSFDPADLLPSLLKGEPISVLNDSGGSVLLKIDQRPHERPL